jgi:MoaA/NifB/PqqE/SkfB family radical SAM enzyme
MFLKRLVEKSYPFLDWIQVEISSYCNACCVYCPHSAYRTNWQPRYLSLEAFQNLMPAFGRTKLIYLQGWGEPFTHPHFFEMLHLAKKADCLVGTTTNGSLLDRQKIEKLINEGLDIIGFSLAGVAENNDQVRKGTHLQKVLKCIEEIHRGRSKFGVDNPRIHIAFMLLRSGLGDLEKLPGFLANTGADQTVISSLSFVVNAEMEAEALLARGASEYVELKRHLSDVRDLSAKLGADVHFHIISPVMDGFNCSENCARTIVVGSDGSVSPCVLKQIPVQGKNCYYFRGQRRVQHNLSFGNISEELLKTIWHRKEHRQFIRDYTGGETPPYCRNCLKGFSDNL